MRRRGIARSEVTKVVHGPDQVLPSKKGRQIRQSFLRTPRRLLLRVVVKEASAAYHVVTAYKTSKLSKYWVKS